MEKAGFEPVDKSDYSPKKGDIIVIQPHPGGSKHGHIAMYDGQQWVSDFKQRDMWGGPGYRANQLRIKVIAAALSLLAGIMGGKPSLAAEEHSLGQGRTAPVLTFHQAVTPSERALEKILHTGKEGGIYDFLTDRDGGRKSQASQFSMFFTNSLLDSIAAQERRLVDRDCGGTYIDGDLCGLGYDPLQCAQDVPEAYFFATEQSTPDRATIVSAWTVHGPPIARYRLVRHRTRWSIDAIACAEGDRFNW